MLRSTILAASRNRRVEHLVTTAPISRSVVRRFVGGPDTDSAVAAAKALVADGLTVTLDHLGEDTTDREHAQASSTPTSSCSSRSSGPAWPSGSAR